MKPVLIYFLKTINIGKNSITIFQILEQYSFHDYINQAKNEFVLCQKSNYFHDSNGEYIGNMPRSYGCMINFAEFYSYINSTTRDVSFIHLRKNFKKSKFAYRPCVLDNNLVESYSSFIKKDEIPLVITRLLNEWAKSAPDSNVYVKEVLNIAI